jgi:hypothetical protein
MTHGETAAHRHPETLPDWITWPAIILIAASFGIRWAAMVQHEFGVVFTTLVFDAAWLLPLWIVSTVPVERFRKLRVPRPPLPQLVLKISLRLAVATAAGFGTFVWVNWGPFAAPIAAGTAYAMIAVAVVASAVNLRNGSAR